MYGPILLLGTVWVLFSLAVPQFDLTTLRSIMVLLGIILLVSAISELPAIASVAPNWRWSHSLLAVLFLVGGIVALAWTHPTFEAVARLAAWYLLVKGVYDMVNAFVARRAEFRREEAGVSLRPAQGGPRVRGASPWWAPLAIGAFEIGIAFWAVAYPRFSLSLLVLWVALAALATGLTKIAMGFRVPAVRGTEVEDELARTGYGPGALSDSARRARETGRVGGGGV
jgi:uncharacterized membrane protein HdeD (DUF308 family)